MRAPHPGFWQQAVVEPQSDGYAVSIAGRMLRTPARAALVVPSEALAQAVAEEWHAQVDTLQPETMPLTRASNVAIDKVVSSQDAVADLLVEYGGSDLLCYRASGPDELVAAQSEGWDPLVAWAEAELDAALVVTTGVMPVTQSPACKSAFARAVSVYDAFRLTALHDLVVLSGSLVLGLAVARQRLSAEAAWDLSRIDESWQASQWGWDGEAAEHAARRQADFFSAMRFLTLLDRPPL